MTVTVFSYPLSLPTSPGVRSVQMTMETIAAVSESPFSFEQQTYLYTGERWKAVITLPVMRRPDAEQWNATMAKLRGRYGTFLLGDPDAKTPGGDARGTPVVNGGGQTGNTLSTKGWLLGLHVLKAGDYFQLGSGSSARMYKLVQDANSDGAGVASLVFWPNLRSSPSDNAPLIVNSAMTQFRLDATFGWDANEVSTYSIRFSATEAL